MLEKNKPTNAPFTAIKLQTGVIKLDTTGAKVIKLTIKAKVNKYTEGAK